MLHLRALSVWFILIAAEILHGIARAVLLVPFVGNFRSRQIGVFTGSVIILAIAVVFVRWIGATWPSQLLGVGVPKITNSNSCLGSAWNDCRTPAGITATLPGRKGCVSGPSVIVPVPERT